MRINEGHPLRKSALNRSSVAIFCKNNPSWLASLASREFMWQDVKKNFMNKSSVIRAVNHSRKGRRIEFFCLQFVYQTYTDAISYKLFYTAAKLGFQKQYKLGFIL
ncbi:hypothetical protein CEXT_71281 [Caerostris extrusa]|uniref:Uncharacterized protein n=1 Tax=Caerostris extrusa TaxID=172846 RepID=A0AAV4U531_CAEEX|nr:hypothetical protein CEXT_71281 [Caerostris extrusa]